MSVSVAMFLSHKMGRRYMGLSFAFLFRTSGAMVRASVICVCKSYPERCTMGGGWIPAGLVA
jgi:hypothetical protein